MRVSLFLFFFPPGLPFLPLAFFFLSPTFPPERGETRDRPMRDRPIPARNVSNGRFSIPHRGIVKMMRLSLGGHAEEKRKNPHSVEDRRG